MTNHFISSVCGVPKSCDNPEQIADFVPHVMFSLWLWRAFCSMMSPGWKFLIVGRQTGNLDLSVGGTNLWRIFAHVWPRAQFADCNGSLQPWPNCWTVWTIVCLFFQGPLGSCMWLDCYWNVCAKLWTKTGPLALPSEWHLDKKWFVQTQTVWDLSKWVSFRKRSAVLRLPCTSCKVWDKMLLSHLQQLNKKAT